MSEERDEEQREQGEDIDYFTKTLESNRVIPKQEKLMLLMNVIGTDWCLIRRLLEMGSITGNKRGEEKYRVVIGSMEWKRRKKESEKRRALSLSMCYTKVVWYEETL